MTIRFKQNSIEFDNGITTFTLNEVAGGFTFTGQLAASVFYSSFQGTVAGYTSGGFTPTASNVIDKFPFATNANATNVGVLLSARGQSAGQSSTTSGYTAAGSFTTSIDKFPFATDSNATNVGALPAARAGTIGNSSSFSGYSSGGESPPASGANFFNEINKFPFATDANSTYVGNLTSIKRYAAGCSSTTSGYTAGGNGAPYPTPVAINVIDKFSFATDTNATDVGDLTVIKRDPAGQSSTVSGYTSGGDLPGASNIIDKFSFATDASATDVGDITSAKSRVTGQSSTDSGYTSGGSPTTNTIDKFPFASNANATDVGDLTVGRYSPAGQQH